MMNFKEKLNITKDKAKGIGTKAKTGINGLFKFAVVTGLKLMALVCVCTFLFSAVRDKVIALAAGPVKEAPEITVLVIEDRLSDIGEFATHEYTYTDQDEVVEPLAVWGHNVPLTKHSYKINYSGVIKAGFRVEDIKTYIVGSKIKVKLPDIEVLDNYINQDSIECLDVKNNIFNPIDADEVSNRLNDTLEIHLEKAISEGLYESAEENAADLIQKYLSIFDGYEVVII